MTDRGAIAIILLILLALLSVICWRTEATWAAFWGIIVAMGLVKLWWKGVIKWLNKDDKTML